MDLIYLDVAEVAIFKPRAKEKRHFHLRLPFFHSPSPSPSAVPHEPPWPLFKMTFSGMEDVKLFGCDTEQDRVQWMGAIGRLSDDLKKEALFFEQNKEKEMGQWFLPHFPFLNFES